MRLWRELLVGAVLVACGIGGMVGYYTFWRTEQKALFMTQEAEQRDIVQLVKATGTLEVFDNMTIGSLVAGIIYKMHVEENQLVKKGDLLVEIDDGLADTRVRETKAALLQARADFAYITAFYKRQKALYAQNHISLDTFQEVTRQYEVVQQEVQLRYANHERANIEFGNKKITAPDDGLVIAKKGAEGETVTLASPPTIIYTLAKDIKQMKAKLEIDESVVGDVKVGMEAELTFDTYPYQMFRGKIAEISNDPKIEKGAISYLATIILDNSELLFRPGMTVDARIVVAQKDDVLAVPSSLFKINPFILADIAKVKGYGYKPLSKKQRMVLKEKESMQTIWLYKEHAFIEHSVKVGINDYAFFEVIEGLEGHEQLVFDTVEPDVMKEFFERFFGKGL